MIHNEEMVRLSTSRMIGGDIMEVKYGIPSNVSYSYFHNRKVFYQKRLNIKKT